MVEVLKKVEEAVCEERLDQKTGIFRLIDHSTGMVHSCHANIFANGSVRGMKDRGFWRKEDRTVRTGGFIYNIDTLVCTSPEDEYTSYMCQCPACISRRKNLVKEGFLDGAIRLVRNPQGLEGAVASLAKNPLEWWYFGGEDAKGFDSEAEDPEIQEDDDAEDAEAYVKRLGTDKIVDMIFSSIEELGTEEKICIYDSIRDRTEEKEMKFEEMSTVEIREAVEESWEALSEEVKAEIEADLEAFIESSDGLREMEPTEAVAEYISDCGYDHDGSLAADDFREILMG